MAVAAVVLVVHTAWIGLFLVGPGHAAIDFVHIGMRQVLQSHASPSISAEAHDPHVTEVVGNDGQFGYYLALDPANGGKYVDDLGYRYARCAANGSARPSLLPTASSSVPASRVGRPWGIYTKGRHSASQSGCLMATEPVGGRLVQAADALGKATVQNQYKGTASPGGTLTERVVRRRYSALLVIVCPKKSPAPTNSPPRLCEGWWGPDAGGLRPERCDDEEQEPVARRWGILEVRAPIIVIKGKDA